MKAIMDANTLKRDIPLNVAVAAHSGTSFSPERRGQQRQEEYAATLLGDFEMLSKYADTPEKREMLAVEFERYRTRYRKHTLAWLQSQSNVISAAIVGPARFPVTRNEKRIRWASNKLEFLIEFRRRALAVMVKKMRPELRPIMAGDSDALERLGQKIEAAEAHQARMKAVNAAHRAYLVKPESIELSDLSEDDKRLIMNYKASHRWEPHPFAPFQLTNHSAKIRTMKERFQQLERAKTKPVEDIKGVNGTLEICPAENRVRIHFAGKPEKEIRERLKRGGFRWAPSLGVWQAYNRVHTIALAKEIVGARPNQAEG